MSDLAASEELRRTGRHEEARRLLVRLARERPADPQVNYAAASVHDFLGRERAAVPYYRAALDAGLTGDDRRGAFLGLGSTYRALGEYEAARATLNAGLIEFPDAAELKVFLAMALYNLGDFHDAMALLLTELADSSGDPALRQYERAIRLYAADLDRRWE